MEFIRVLGHSIKTLYIPGKKTCVHVDAPKIKKIYLPDDVTYLEKLRNGYSKEEIAGSMLIFFDKKKNINEITFMVHENSKTHALVKAQGLKYKFY